MDNLIKVFLDDARDTPIGWVRTYTVSETKKLLETGKVSHLSVDNDLGILLPDGTPDHDEEGFNVLNWLEEQLYFGKIELCPICTLHSDNAGRGTLARAAIKAIHNRFRDRQIQDP